MATPPLFRLDRLLGTAEPTVPRPSAAQLERARAVRASVDPLRLRAIVERLAEPRSRLNAPEGMARAERFVMDALAEAGWDVAWLPFELEHERGVEDVPKDKKPYVYPRLEGANVLGVREAEARSAGRTPAPAITVVAHLDTVRGSPGADDNASGVAVLLELARLLPRLAGRTVVLAFVDYEEIGMVGSRVLVAEQLRRWDVRGAIVFDAIGFRSLEPGSQRIPGGLGALYPGQIGRVGERAAGDFAAILYRESSRRLARVLAAWLHAAAPGTDTIMLRDPVDLPAVGGLAGRVPAARNFGRSDHSRFWDAGLPAVLLTDMAPFRNPAYHEPGDRPDTLDYEFLADVAAATLLTVESIRLDR